MFSRGALVSIGVALFIAVNFTVLTMTSRNSLSVNTLERFSIFITTPFQQAVTKTISMTQSVWRTYFLSVLAVEENRDLKKRLSKAMEVWNRSEELEHENRRLRKFVNFTQKFPATYVAAQVIARDPSPWFKTLIIDKGAADGLSKGAPVLVSEGIVGQVIQVGDDFAKVLLVIDRNSSVDALVQDTRVRGMVKGNNDDPCTFVYALRKDDIKPGETIVSSGLDRVFPKGLKIGTVRAVAKEHSQLFQDIIIETSVDFDKLEDVLVLQKGN